VLKSLGANFRYAAGLRSFLRSTLDVVQARTIISRQMQTREPEQGQTLRVQRREPYLTSNAKVQPLHVVPATKPL
jgi:hypothetical protein